MLRCKRTPFCVTIFQKGKTVTKLSTCEDKLSPMLPSCNSHICFNNNNLLLNQSLLETCSIIMCGQIHLKIVQEKKRENPFHSSSSDSLGEFRQAFKNSIVPHLILLIILINHYYYFQSLSFIVSSSF